MVKSLDIVIESRQICMHINVYTDLAEVETFCRIL